MHVPCKCLVQQVQHKKQHNNHLHAYVYVSVHVYVCLCVCVCIFISFLFLFLTLFFFTSNDQCVIIFQVDQFTDDAIFLIHCEVIGPLYSVRQCTVGKGVFADCAIDRDTFLFEYVGRQVHADVIDDVDGDIEYQWRLSNGYIIDGSIGGNDSRFINHFVGL